MGFAFARLHADIPVLKTMARFLAKMPYDRHSNSRKWVEGWLGEIEKAAAGVMKAYLQMTRYEESARYLEGRMGIAMRDRTRTRKLLLRCMAGYLGDLEPAYASVQNLYSNSKSGKG